MSAPIQPAHRAQAGARHAGRSASQVALPRQCELLFPGLKDQPLSDTSLTAVLRRMQRTDITVHGFRFTFHDWCAEAAGNAFTREVCEHALAHSLPDRVEAACRRGDLLEKRILLMQTWADYCGRGESG